MSMNAEELQKITPEAFETMRKEEHLRYELIDGIIMMSPSPSKSHQWIGMLLSHKLMDYLKGTPCRPLYELDVKWQDNVFKPDLMVFCNDEEDIPEIIFEILSPSTRYRDLNVKLFKYEEMGVKEYWIIDPKVKTITVHDFVNQTAEVYSSGETIHSQILPEIVIAVADIFV